MSLRGCDHAASQRQATLWQQTPATGSPRLQSSGRPTLPAALPASGAVQIRGLPSQAKPATRSQVCIGQQTCQACCSWLSLLSDLPQRLAPCTQRQQPSARAKSPQLMWLSGESPDICAGRGPGLAPIASVPNGFGRPRPDSLAQLRQGEGLADPHLWSYDDLAFVPPLRPFSATSHRYEGGTATNKARSHDSAVDGVHSTLVAELQQARAAAAAGDRGRGRMGVMTPPPPPPPRTMTPQPELDPYENGIERQGSFQVMALTVHVCLIPNGSPCHSEIWRCLHVEVVGSLCSGAASLRLTRTGALRHAGALRLHTTPSLTSMGCLQMTWNG